MLLSLLLPSDLVSPSEKPSESTTDHHCTAHIAVHWPQRQVVWVLLHVYVLNYREDIIHLCPPWLSCSAIIVPVIKFQLCEGLVFGQQRVFMSCWASQHLGQECHMSLQGCPLESHVSGLATAALACNMPRNIRQTLCVNVLAWENSQALRHGWHLVLLAVLALSSVLEPFHFVS